MKSLIIKNITEKNVNKSFLKTISPHIVEVRNIFYKYCETLPTDLCSSLILHFQERNERASGTLMLGEYAPFILGDLFSISHGSIKNVAFPWFLMYEYSLLLDDLIDKERVNWHNELLSSQLILDKSYHNFFVSVNNRKQLFDSLEKYRKQSVDSMLHEKSWSIERDIKDLNNSIIIQGRKAALVKFCVTYMFNLDSNRIIFPQEEKVLDNICAAIQLLDDLTDFYEDYSENRINLLLNTTFKWLNNNYPNINCSTLSYDQLVSALVLSQSVNTTLEFSGNLLSNLSETIKPNPSNSGSYSYFLDIANQCFQKSSLIDNEVSKNINLINKFKEYIFGQNNLKVDETNADFTMLRNLFLHLLSISPKASN